MLGNKSRRVGTLGAYRASLGASTLRSLPTRGGSCMIGAWMTDALRERTAAQTTEDPMDHDSGVITHPKFRMWLRPDGIVQLVWAPRTTVLLEDATAALEATAQLTGGRLRPLLVDMRDTGPQDRLARAEWTSRTDLSSAVALIVGTPLSRMMRAEA